MKPILCLLCALAVSTSRGDTVDLLARTTTVPVGNWPEIRDAILAEGVSCTGTLAKTIADSRRDWRERFMANVCMEHLSNSVARDLFFKDPLRDDPERDPNWISTAAGYAYEEIPLFKKRLCETQFWFSGLEAFAWMQGEEPLHPLWRRADTIIFEAAPDDIRRFAALIAEQRVREYYSGMSPYADSFIAWLRQYVLDGTYPEGSALLLSHLETTNVLPITDLRAMICQVDDLELLKTVATRFANVRSWEHQLLEERIAEIESETNMVGNASEKLRLENEPETRSNVSPRSVSRPEKRLPPGVMFRGKNTMPDLSF